MVLNHARVSTQMPKVITGARIALLEFPLQRHRMQLGIQVCGRLGHGCAGS